MRSKFNCFDLHANWYLCWKTSPEWENDCSQMKGNPGRKSVKKNLETGMKVYLPASQASEAAIERFRKQPVKPKICRNPWKVMFSKAHHPIRMSLKKRQKLSLSRCLYLGEKYMEWVAVLTAAKGCSAQYWVDGALFTQCIFSSIF